MNLLIVSFTFIHHPYFVWTATSFCLSSEWNCATVLCMNVTQIPCVSSPLPLCKCHTCASPFSLCECHTNIVVSTLLLSGHSALFYFRSRLTHLLFFFRFLDLSSTAILVLVLYKFRLSTFPLF